MHVWKKKPYLIGMALYYFMRCMRLTMRIKVHKHPSIDAQKGYLFAFWHGKQLLPSIVLQQYHHTVLCTVVSPSRDGSLLTTYLNKFGYEVIRGSSRSNNVAALISMKKKLLAGASVGTGVDGPIGPIHIVKPGIPYLAQKYNVPVIPMGSAFSSYWVFQKAWDKFQFPKPFSKAVLVLGEPYMVPQDMDMAQACADLRARLHQVEQQALDLL